MKTIVAKILIVVFLTGTQVLGYPPQERLTPDGAPVPTDTVVHEDSVASASEIGEEYEDGDDSDMYMEEAGGTSSETDRIDKGREREEEEEEEEERGGSESYANTTERGRPSNAREEVVEDGKTEASSATSAKWTDQEAENTKETTDSEERSLETESQNFFPSFADLFANQRSSFAEQQRYRAQNRFLGYLQRDRNGYQTSAVTVGGKDVHHPLLGSGNFGVIRGGTYYPEEKENDEYSVDDTLYNPYYHGGNRGRANYYRNPKPQPVRGGDFFANFRDFADITAPPKSSFSHLSVVYANKNATGTRLGQEPRNIIETLRMLEEEGQTSSEVAVGTELPRKKQSKGKRKLMKMKQYEEDKARRSSSRITVEPLLALS
ncbi:uncharacterized protein LOC100577847 isoform X1 [Apis mellifera]|uniref:Uncharacterized protein LOC100577847 isoform X1 n=2 Tax=Apis mellifera TaxID=7460 RepID=A0A7M7GBM8_APIME|nr:uncharacterized protein LOC100577847 isoform X1 [Apis mellifera]|eukprot:XP_003251792.1 uncharacterized protein LOC100577847 isoform X1 [Apis mellifera]